MRSCNISVLFHCDGKVFVLKRYSNVTAHLTAFNLSLIHWLSSVQLQFENIILLLHISHNLFLIMI